MADINIYKFAVQNRIGFSSVRGVLSTEQLFGLPLTSRDGFNLDDVARAVNKELKELTEESFVAPATNPRKKVLEVALEIVKDVIATRQAENAATVARAKKAEDRRKILDAINAQQDKKLSESSIADLQKQLAALDEEDDAKAA